jgi:hypothetical protein
MARCGDKLVLVAALLLFGVSGAAAEDGQVNTIQDIFRHLRTCWKPPPAAKARPLDITVVVSFNRSGDILGHRGSPMNPRRPPTMTGCNTGSR